MSCSTISVAGRLPGGVGAAAEGLARGAGGVDCLIGLVKRTARHMGQLSLFSQSVASHWVMHVRPKMWPQERRIARSGWDWWS